MWCGRPSAGPSTPSTDVPSSLVEASTAQQRATAALRTASAAAYAEALERVEGGMTDGTLLRGEVLARWQEYVGTGEFFRQVESTISRIRDRITAAVKGGPPPTDNLGEALQSGVAALVSAQSQAAASAGSRAWRTLPGGPPCCQSTPGWPSRRRRWTAPSRGWCATGRATCSTWSAPRAGTGARRPASRIPGSTASASSSCWSRSRTPVGWSVQRWRRYGGTAVLAQKVLEAIFGDQAAEMAAKARTRLLAKVEELKAGERARFDAALEGVEVKEDQAARPADAAAVKAVR